MSEVFFSQDHPALFGEMLEARHAKCDYEGLKAVRSQPLMENPYESIDRDEVAFLVPGRDCVLTVRFPGARVMFENGKKYLVLIGEPKEE